MRVRFLGTSAGELDPGLWCRCRNCQTARQGDARDWRQSAALYVEPGGTPLDLAAPSRGLLLDFPSEIADQARRHCSDLPALQYLLVTHSHGDHWFPDLLAGGASQPSCTALGEHRGRCPKSVPSRFTYLPTLHILGNAAASVLHRELGDDLAAFAIAFHPVRAGDTWRAGDFSVTVLEANHDVGREEALHYVVADGGRNFCFTGWTGIDFPARHPGSAARVSV